MIKRRSRGASLVLVIAVFGFAALMIMFFGLKYTGFLGSYHEQKSAIEAAALVAAKDLSAVVIDDPNFGLVGLSDFSPIGTATIATDGYCTSVTGINTLLGTIRLDLIIADYLEDPVMSALVQTDYNNALITQKNLVTALTNSITLTGTAQDKDGNLLTPYQDAVNTYNANKVHLVAGQSANLLPGSLKLTLGFIDGLGTRTMIPQPPSVGVVNLDQQAQGCYLATQEIDYKSTPFVFAALGLNATLVDGRAFQATMSNLPFATPSVIKVDADESYSDNNEQHIIHAMAASLAGTVVDQRPNPGSFTITFPYGAPPEITQPGDLINNPQVQTDPTDIMQTPLVGDYPQTLLSNYSMPFLVTADPAHPQFEDVFSVAFYDWIRAGGTSVNVQSLISMLSTPFNFGAGGPQVQIFHLTSSGAITNNVTAWPGNNLCVSNKQYRALSGLGIVSTNGNSYDLQITDCMRVLGRTNGGAHAGNPLTNPGQIGANAAGSTYVSGSLYENTTLGYQEFQTGTGVRPTYNQDGVGIDFTIRMRK
jgi:hypothetical protein